MAKENLKTANMLTLNIIQETLDIKTNKRDFLKMIFPEFLRYEDRNSLVEFIFSSDASNQSTRSVFVNGNMIKNKKAPTYSRANQEALSFIAEQMNNSSCFSDMVELIGKNFGLVSLEIVDKLYKIDCGVYPDDFKLKILNIYKTKKVHTLLAMPVLWAVYGERINLIHFENSENKITALPADVYPYQNIMNYFHSNMTNLSEVESVDFAFLSGLRWITDNERVDIIKKFLENGIPLNIIISEPKKAKMLGMHMRHPEKTYIPFEQCYGLWLDFYKKHTDLIKIKISPFPPLRNYYSFNRKDGTSEIMFIMYTYGNPTFNKNFSEILDSSSEYYETLKKEFDYLWKNSADMETYAQT